MRFRTVLLFGAPGVGKGTQGRVLGHVPGLIHVACGDVFRSLPADSKLGRTFVEYSSRGELVPDHLTVQLWERHIHALSLSESFNPSSDILLLDGIPRNREQAKLLARKIDVYTVIHMTCSNHQALHERIRRRALREGRYDDASDAIIAHRLAVYEAETAQTLSFYSGDIIHTVQADQSPLRVLAELAHVIDGIVQRDPIPPTDTVGSTA